MQDFTITFTVETINIDTETLRARLVEFIESGELELADNLKEHAEIAPETVKVTPLEAE